MADMTADFHGYVLATLSNAAALASDMEAAFVAAGAARTEQTTEQGRIAVYGWV